MALKYTTTPTSSDSTSTRKPKDPLPPDVIYGETPPQDVRPRPTATSTPQTVPTTSTPPSSTPRTRAVAANRAAKVAKERARTLAQMRRSGAI